MTEKELRESVCAAARAWLGLREQGGGHRPVVEAYNAIRPLPAGYTLKLTDPWCAAFVSAAGARAGLTELVLPECSCPRMMALYKAASRWEEVDFAVPKPGDVVFYDWDGDRIPDHVGLVENLEEDVLTVLEGNKSDAAARRRISMDSPHILGYGQPDYAKIAESKPSESGFDSERKREGADMELSTQGGSEMERVSSDAGQPDYASRATPSAQATAAVGAGLAPPADHRTGSSQPAGADAPGGPSFSLPLLSTGSAGETVRALQLLLIGRGCRCGPWGADGEFGPGTKGGVMSWQRGHGLEVDGVVGAQTWASLLGLEVRA